MNRQETILYNENIKEQRSQKYVDMTGHIIVSEKQHTRIFDIIMFSLVGSIIFSFIYAFAFFDTTHNTTPVIVSVSIAILSIIVMIIFAALSDPIIYPPLIEGYYKGDLLKSLTKTSHEYLYVLEVIELEESDDHDEFEPISRPNTYKVLAFDILGSDQTELTINHTELNYYIVIDVNPKVKEILKGAGYDA